MNDLICYQNRGYKISKNAEHYDLKLYNVIVGKSTSITALLQLLHKKLNLPKDRVLYIDGTWIKTKEVKNATA